MSRRPNPLPPRLPDVFTPRQARDLGVAAGRLQARDLVRPYRGVRQRADPLAPAHADPWLAPDEVTRRRVMRLACAYALVMPPGSFFAGRTAAVLRGLPIAHEGDELTVGVYAPARPPRRPGIRGTKVSPSLASVVTYEGLRLTTPATTWAMLAAGLDERELIVLGDAIVRIPRGAGGRPLPAEQLATTADLAAAAAARGRRHRTALEAALARIRVGSMSPLETDYRLLAADAGLPEPALDLEIRDASGRLIGIGDAVYPSFRVVVEIEGDHHRTDARQWARDIEKHAAYVAAGWEVVRLTKLHIRGRRPAAARIVGEVLRRRAAQS